MTNFLIPSLRACALALACVGAAVGPAYGQAAKPATEHFFQDAPFADPQLSPNGRFLAVRVARAGKRDALAVVNLDTGSMNGVAMFDDVDVGNFMWVNDDRLVFDTTNRQLDTSLSRAPGLIAINRDGSERVQLVMREGDDEGIVQGLNSNIKPKEMLKVNHFMLQQTGAQNSDFMYVIRPQFDGAEMRFVDLKKVHTKSLRVLQVPRPAAVARWLLDHQGEPRIAVAIDKDVKTIHYLDPANGQWRPIASFTQYIGNKDAFEPIAFGPDGVLYVRTMAGKDKFGVHTFDFATGKVNPSAMIATGHFDFIGELVFNKDKLLGMRLTTDAESNEWFDPAMKALQATIDKLLPGTANLISVGLRSDSPFVLVETYADVQPSTYLVYNKDTKTLLKIGASKPAILAAQMGKVQPVRYKARDGMDIPGWLTLPAGSTGKNLPLVVLVHGGPYMRGGSWRWNAESQFLASRGYAVLEPEFRGSTGYGEAHFRAGWKQWGLAMQNDVADGAKWAVKQGMVDPQRICIAGASYGGYSALMGLVNDPELFKCAINWVGVTDINLLYDGKWNFDDDMSERFKKYAMPELIGDRVKDAAQLNATSPLAQAARIKQPVLLAYGGTDRRVPAFHGEQFYKAVKGHNAGAEFVVYADEGHGWRMQKTNVDFWNRVELFLGKHIGKQ